MGVKRFPYALLCAQGYFCQYKNCQVIGKVVAMKEE